MCSPNIARLIIEISIQVNELISAKTREIVGISPKPAPSETAISAQKAFLLLCDLFKIRPVEPSDESSIMDASKNVGLLLNAVTDMPGFKLGDLDAVSSDSYTSAIKALDERQWFDIKSSLIVCRSLIYRPDSKAPDADAYFSTPAWGPA